MKNILTNTNRLLYLLGILVTMAIANPAQAQNIQITEDPLIAKMMERFVEINKARTSVEGWRIQVLATTDRQKLEVTRQNFQYRYPNIPIDWVHSKPYYKLRAGAFVTKLEALRLKHILERDYSGIYLVKDDNIRPSEFINTY